jgi:hypothetical protein
MHTLPKETVWNKSTMQTSEVKSPANVNRATGYLILETEGRRLVVLVVRLDELQNVSGTAVSANWEELVSLLVSRLDAEGDVDELAGALLEDEVGAVGAVR